METDYTPGNDTSLRQKVMVIRIRIGMLPGENPILLLVYMTDFELDNFLKKGVV